MARAATATHLPLDRYARVMGLPLAHFNHLRDERATHPARAYWSQTQHDDLARYIAQAEALLRDGSRARPGLRFEVAPTARTDRLLLDPADDDWTATLFQAPAGHIQALGRPVQTLVAAEVAVLYQGDAAVIALSEIPAGIRADEIVVHYRVADGAEAAGSESWRIAPLVVHVASMTATIIGHKAQFVLPAVREADASGDYGDPANFVAAVDVYRVTVDETLPVTLHWDGLTQPALARLHDATLGTFTVHPAAVRDTLPVYVAPLQRTPPDHITVQYIAGHALNGRHLAPPLESAVVRLANVLSPGFEHWLSDLAAARWRNDRALPDEAHPLQPGEEDCPFGLTQGARFAWSVAQQLRVPAVGF